MKTSKTACSGYRFEWRDFLKRLAVLAIPVALQNLLTTTGSMVDTMMISKLGETNVAAVGLCAQFSSLMLSCYWGFVGGGMLFFAQFWGARDDDGIDRSYGLTLLCMMTVGVLFGLAALLAPDVVMSIYTDKPSIRAIGVEYLKIVGFAYPLQVLAMAMSALLRSTERVRIPLAGAMTAVITNLFLNWVFIYGNLGMPAMGVRGAALATVCANAVNVIVIYACALFKGYPYLFHITAHFRWSSEGTRQFFVKCFPILCNELLIGIGNMVINIVLGRQVEEAIAALAVFRTIEGLIIGFFAGFSNAASVLVGASVGAGELRTAYERAKRLIYLCSGVIAVLGVCIIAMSGTIMRWMNLSGEAYYYGCGLLIIFSIVAVIRMGNWCQNDTYRSAGDAVTGTVMEIIAMYVLLLPLVCVTGLYIHAPFFVVFICCYVDEPVRYILMQIHLYSGKWIRPVTEQGRAELPAFMNELKGRKS